MDRRSFLVGAGAWAAAPVLAPLAAGCLAPVRDAGAPPPGFTEERWRTVAAVQAHLLPSEPNAPGAREIRAESFLRGVLGDPRFAPAERAFLIGGVETVNKLAHEAAGRPFVALSPAQRESVLRAFEATPEGGRWLAEMLGYLLEAALGDPVYSGNPGGIGWNWLAHNPGFPRPPVNKRYFLLRA